MLRIYGYHNNPDMPFRNMNPDGSIAESPTPTDGLLYLGAEIETDYVDSSYDRDEDSDDDDDRTTDWNSSYLERTLRTCNFLDYVSPTRDGSLENGCEFVSGPMTIEAWLAAKDSFEDGFRALLSVGLRAHDTTTCGLHVHVSRSFFKGSEVAWSVLLLILEQNWPDMTRIARRKSSHYAKRILEGEADRSSSYRQELIKKEGGKLWAKTGSDRYVALNFNNDNTIEFRLFRGTLNIETFYATLQFVWNLCNLAANLTLQQALDVTIQDVIAYKKWPELDAYAKRLKFDLNHEVDNAELRDQGDE